MAELSFAPTTLERFADDVTPMLRKPFPAANKLAAKILDQYEDKEPNQEKIVCGDWRHDWKWHRNVPMQGDAREYLRNPERGDLWEATIAVLLALADVALDRGQLVRQSESRLRTLKDAIRDFLGVMGRENLMTEFTPLEKALALLVKHPEWSDTQIAQEVGVSRTTLYKPSWHKFQAAREAIKSERASLPRGKRNVDGQHLEAWKADQEDK